MGHAMATTQELPRRTVICLNCGAERVGQLHVAPHMGAAQLDQLHEGRGGVRRSSPRASATIETEKKPIKLESTTWTITTRTGASSRNEVEKCHMGHS